MPALDFPAGAATGQTFAAGNGVVYTYNGTVWLASGASAGGDFYATGAGGAINTSGPAVIFPGSVVTGNSGGWYSTSTGRFTPPAGRYCIFTNVYVTAGGAAAGVFVYLHKNGSQIPNNAAANSIGASAAGSFALDAIVDANGTDYFDVRATAFAAATASVMGFGGFPISGIKGPPGDATPGTLIQTVSTQTGAVATGTTVIPYDDTIPQQTEGDQYMSLTITPKSATSKLVITVVITMANSASALQMCAALFQDSAANALATTTRSYMSIQPTMVTLNFTHVMTSGTTSATTFKIRGGTTAPGTTTFNGSGGLRYFGGVMASSIVIQEVAP